MEKHHKRNVFHRYFIISHHQSSSHISAMDFFRMTKESQSQPEMVFDAILMALPVLLMIQIIAERYQHVGLGNRAHVVEIFNPNMRIS